MTSAAILSLEEFRDAQRRTEVRQRLFNRFEHWMQHWENHVKEPNPTLEELTQAVLALRQVLTPAVTEALVEHAHRAALEQRTRIDGYRVVSMMWECPAQDEDMQPSPPLR